MLSDTELWPLHQQLLDGSPTASEALISKLLEPLVNSTQTSFPGIDPQVVADGVIDALLDYTARPQSIAVGSGVELRHALSTAAWRNVANLLRGEKRRIVRETKAVIVGRSEAVEVPDAVERLVQEEDAASRAKLIDGMMALLPSEIDRAVLRLQLDGERGTVKFAEVLGVMDLPYAEQQKHVKRVKDRIGKIINRHKRANDRR